MRRAQSLRVSYGITLYNNLPSHSLNWSPNFKGYDLRKPLFHSKLLKEEKQIIFLMEFSGYPLRVGGFKPEQTLFPNKTKEHFSFNGWNLSDFLWSA
ncbi:hypothetical protein CDAR_111861 [Caerostris darwini]|uniref:Uncharacterized protein n=1 Tax=Caerostris darwini TaxID=1538125 RepID=A0AAV4U5D9_9ARAC|nr:hypothetical protein CDAR_111861 [Caerostris darwini]